MKRLHVMIQVKDLEASKHFYRTLFDAEPTVEETDYAKWMLEDPRVNFSIATRAQSDRLGVEHLGIQAESEAELDELRTRLERLQGSPDVAIFDEGETVCCYHRSDKSWITDAQGVSWEAFYTSGRATSSTPPPARPASHPTPEVAEACCALSSPGCSADGAPSPALVHRNSEIATVSPALDADLCVARTRKMPDLPSFSRLDLDADDSPTQ